MGKTISNFPPTGSEVYSVNNPVESEEAIRRKIELLKSLNIPCHHKVNLMLVYLGLKPATEYPVERSFDDVKTIERVLDEVGLHYRKDVPEPSPREWVRKAISALLEKTLCTVYTGVYLFVAKKKEDADLLYKINKKAPDIDLEGEYIELMATVGRLYGFPETAIQAYIGNGEILREENYPPEYFENVGQFFLSRDHYMEEIEAMKRWTEAIRKYAPDSCEEVLQRKE